MRLLVVTDWEFPCDEPFMREVYSKRWQNAGHDIAWVMRPSTEYKNSKQTWNGAPVYIPGDDLYKYTNIIDPRGGAANWFDSVWDNEGGFDIVQVRNDLTVTNPLLELTDRHQTPLIFRHSHLKAETLMLGYRQSVEGYSFTDYMKGLLGGRLRDRFLSQADTTFTISQAMSKYHREKRGIETPLRSVPMGVDTTISRDQIDPEPFCSDYELDPDSYLIYMGSMNPLRNLEFLFKALSLVQNSHPDIRLVMVGGRDEAARERLRSLANSHGVNKSIIFTGWVEDSRLRQAIAGAAIGLSPLPPNDVFRTNSPTKVLEYLNLEIPAITTRTPEQVDMVEAGGGGKAVEYSPATFAEAITDLLNDPVVRRQMGKTGKEFVARHRSYDSILEEILGHYNELITN